MSSEINSTSTNTFYTKRSLLVGLILLGAVSVFLWVFNLYNPIFSVNKEATLALTYENGGKGRFFKGEVVSGMTILDALITSSNVGQIELNYGLNEAGKVVIASLDGYEKKTSDKKLAFYLNGRKIEEGIINKTTIKSGDKIEVKLE